MPLSLRSYLPLISVFLVFLVLVLFPGVVSRPLAFLSGVDVADFVRLELAGLVFTATLIAARYVRLDFVHGILERRAGKTLPQLIGQLSSFVVLLVGFLCVMTGVYGQNVTAILATGGLGLAVIGIALQPVILSIFTGMALNVDKSFDVGDRVRIGGITGRVMQVTWRSIILQSSESLISIPNVTLGTVNITNLDKPDRREQHSLEIRLDYDVTVDSAERILLAAVLDAERISLVGPPTVHAVRMEPDGVVYEIDYVIVDNALGKDSEHAVIRSVLSRLREANLTISYPKREMFQSEQRVRMADRAFDRFVLVRECLLFRSLPDSVLHAIANALIRRLLAPGEMLVSAGDDRPSLFIVGEGMISRRHPRLDKPGFAEERLVTTQYFGQDSLIAGVSQRVDAVAVTAALVFELSHDAYQAIAERNQDHLAELVEGLSRVAATGRSDLEVDIDMTSVAVRREPAFYRGQLVQSLKGDGRTPADI